MKFYWFGDSWVKGAELEKLLPAESCQKSSFPQLVSNYYNAECVNLGVNGYGVDCLPWTFIFTTQETPMMDLTTADSWLLPRNQCIASAILPYIDNDSGMLSIMTAECFL